MFPVFFALLFEFPTFFIRFLVCVVLKLFARLNFFSLPFSYMIPRFSHVLDINCTKKMVCAASRKTPLPTSKTERCKWYLLDKICKSYILRWSETFHLHRKWHVAWAQYYSWQMLSIVWMSSTPQQTYSRNDRTRENTQGQDERRIRRSGRRVCVCECVRDEKTNDCENCWIFPHLAFGECQKWINNCQSYFWHQYQKNHFLLTLHTNVRKGGALTFWAHT